MSRNLTRREFLFTSALTAAGAALAACAGPAAAPATTAPVAQPTTAPAVQPTAIPTQAAPATAVPTLAPEAAGKEAPMLAERVAKGELPPVKERLPVNPLVLAPIHGIGKYGGTLRTFSNNLGNHWEECQYGHSPLRWIDDGLGIAPGHVESWTANADNSEWTLNFRKGLKWSDGEPCTVDDVLFWWEDLVINPDQSDNPPDFGTAGGKLAEFVKGDDYTLTIKYAAPAPLTAKRLAMWVNGCIGPRWITPKHYMQQFHPKYNTTVTDYKTFDEKILWRQNPDCPSLTAWIPESYAPGTSRQWVRNPYYYAVDTEGNQLPYIDRIDEIQVEDAEVQKLTIMQGGVDYIHFHKLALADVSVLQDSQQAGDYEVRFWDSGSGTGQMYFWNHDVQDENLRALYRDVRFKRALSHALDRATIQRVVYYNTGFPTTGSMSPKAIEFNFNDEARAMYAKQRDAYVEYSPDKAMALLDEIGMKDVDGDGFREMPDGSKYDLRVDIQADASKEPLSVLEIATENWKAIGLNVVINQIPPAEFGPTWRDGQLQFRTNWEVGDGPDHLLYPSWVVPNETERWAPLCGRRLELQGTEAAGQEKDVDPWERKPPRFNDDERDLIGEPVWKLQEIYEVAKIEVDEMKRMSLVWDMINIHVDDGPFYIGTVANYPRIIFVSNKLMNVPQKEELKLGGFVNPWIIPYPAVVNTETYSFK